MDVSRPAVRLSTKITKGHEKWAYLALIGFVRAWLWWYASNDYRLIDKELNPRKIARLNRRELIVPLIFLFSIVVVAFNPMIAMWSWGLVGLTFALR